MSYGHVGFISQHIKRVLLDAGDCFQYNSICGQNMAAREGISAGRYGAGGDDISNE